MRRAQQFQRLGCAVLLLLWPAALVAGGIHDLVRGADAETVIRFIDTHGPESACAVEDGGVTPLHIAAALNKTGVAAALLNHTANVNACTEGGFSPLHWAASRDACATAELLIRRGANVSAETPDGITPLHWAAANNATNVVMLLLAHGAGPDRTTDEGFTPLHWALLRGAETAAIMVAFKKASDEIDRGLTNSPSPPSGPPAGPPAPEPDASRLADAPDRPDATPVSGDPRLIPSLPSPPLPRRSSGQPLVIDLGFGQQIEGVWLSDLRIWAGKTEITNGQFRRFDRRHDSGNRDGLSLNADNQPAVRVSWQRASDFCTWLNTHYAEALPPGYLCRLPASADWTGMARCGTDRVYPWGNAWPPAYGNFADETARELIRNWQGIAGYTDGHAVTCPVLESGVNEWGLYGLAGNAWEWCDDWHDEARRYRVRRGACWDFDTEIAMRIETTGFDRPAAAYDTIGFRIVVAPIVAP